MEKKVTMVFEKETKNMVRYISGETGVHYWPKVWFDGKIPPKITVTVTAE